VGTPPANTTSTDNTLSMNGMAASPNWLYMYDGKTLQKRNKTNYGLVSSVGLAGPVCTHGGLAADACDQVYAGNGTTLSIYNSALTNISNTGLPGTIYAVTLGLNSADVYVSGDGFVEDLLNPKAIATVSATPTNTTCGLNNGSATANLSLTCSIPGTISYSWSPGGQNTQTATNLATGTYTCTMSFGCGASYQAVVNIGASGPPVISVSPATICNGGNATLTASGVTSYAWSTGATTASINVTPGSTTTYTVNGSSGGCAASPQTAVVTVNPNPSVSINPSPASICPGGNVTLNGAGANTYVWSTGSAANSINVSPGSTTTYSVTGTDGNGCKGTNTVTVTVNPLPTISITPPSPGICPGGEVLLTGSGAVTYAWNTGQTTDTLTVGPASTTTYTLTGTDANGCSNNTTVTVNVGAVVVTASAAPPAVCSGSSTTITASGAANYSWSTGATTAVINVSPTVATTYSVIGSSGSCNSTATVTVNVNPTPTITASSISATVCPGDTTSAFANISGGTPSYSYAWSSGQTTATASGLGAGTYTVTVTDANTCASNSATVTINVNNIVVTASAANPNLCGGGSTVLTATGATNYTWSLSTGLTTTTYDTTTANPGTTVTYTVMGTTTGTCKDSATVVITVNPAPTITANAVDTSICTGGAGTSLNASGASTYVWSDGFSGTPDNVNPASSTTYTVTGTDVNGCIGTATVSIAVNPTPTVSITVSPLNDTVCPGQSVTITANSSAGSYAWSDGSTTSAVTFTPVTSPTTYSVVATSGACSSNASQTVYIYSPVALGMIPSDSMCSGGSVTIGALATGGKAAYNYVWTPASIGSGPGPFVVSPAVSSTYSCTVTDGCGTMATSSTQVVITPAATAAFTATPNPVPGGQFVSFIDNSVGAASWHWTFGDGGTSAVSFPYHEYDTAGTYLVTLYVRSANGCRDSVTDTIHVIELIYVPNVFTPNGDGQNDVFHVTAESIKKYSIEIFNRWGERVFTASSPNVDWDGRSEGGVKESDGIYYYIILATDFAGKNFKYDGYVQLIGGGGTQ